ncbi:hypothetical protein OIU74_010462 [Salix koriyanagi]|uniref:Secreted protein n=1 Tax=Salix koriyanagi TaxID=2511006 RepID=A0A9Q0TCZ8_9ROSI|nr:hypothetical protein OIU74_010462 [Salix koriyanagi]
MGCLLFLVLCLVGLDFLWLAAPPLSMGSPPIVPAAAHTQVPPVSSICNHGHHFLLEVCGAPIVRGISRCTATPWSFPLEHRHGHCNLSSPFDISGTLLLFPCHGFNPPTKFGTPPHLANQGMMAISPAMGQNGASLAGQPKDGWQECSKSHSNFGINLS